MGFAKISVFGLFLLGYSAAALSAESEFGSSDNLIPHAATVNGMTGLFFTNSAFSLAKGKYEIGTGVLMERSGLPAYSMLQIPFNVTYGLSDKVEIGINGKSTYLDLVGQGLGDLETNVKWRIAEPKKTSDGSYTPAVAFGLGLILPTAATGLGEVSEWGARLMFLLSSEGTLPDGRYIGTYLDAQAITIDAGTGSPFEDNYWALNLGLLLPYRDEKNFQIVSEVNLVRAKKTISPGSSDFNGLTLGLRYASDTLRLSSGVQFVNKLDNSLKDTSRVIATASIEF